MNCCFIAITMLKQVQHLYMYIIFIRLQMP